MPLDFHRFLASFFALEIWYGFTLIVQCAGNVLWFRARDEHVPFQWLIMAELSAFLCISETARVIVSGLACCQWIRRFVQTYSGVMSGIRVDVSGLRRGDPWLKGAAVPTAIPQPQRSAKQCESGQSLVGWKRKALLSKWFASVLMLCWRYISMISKWT